MSQASSHANLISKQISTNIEYFSYHRNHLIIRHWLTQEGTPLETLQAVVVQVSALEDPILALKVAEILQIAITHTKLNRINVLEMVYNEWDNEMLC